LAALSLPERTTARLRVAVDRKAEAELAQLLGEIPGLPPLARNAVLTLPRLMGDARVLAEAEAICLNTTMMQALSDLAAVADLLAAYGVADGITFEGFAPGLGFNLVSGGRYDELIGHFGPPLAAVGWALTLDRVLLARELQGISHDEPRCDVLLSARDCPTCLRWAAQARARGLKVELDPLGLAPDALWQAAQARGIPRAAHHTGPQTLTVWDATGTRTLSAEDWQEVAAWLNR
jgi:ATP phosphoribosyltransferase regulatory subunit